MFKKLFVLSGFIQDFYSNDAGEKRIFIVVFFFPIIMDILENVQKILIITDQ